MVTEWEKQELSRLTNLKVQAHTRNNQQSEQEAGIQPGRMTTENLLFMKNVQKQTDTKEAKIKAVIERLKLAITTSIGGLFSAYGKNRKSDNKVCKVYGHNLPWGTSWKGEFPRCMDCNAIITEATQLRGAIPMEERTKFKSYGEK